MKRLLIVLFVLSVGANSVFCATIPNFVSELEKKCFTLKELKHSYNAFSEGIKAARGEFDTFLTSDVSYQNQDGGVSGSFTLDNMTSKALQIGVKKKWKYGFSTEFKHQLSKSVVSMATLPTSMSTYLPISTLSISIPILNNYLGVNDRKNFKNIDLKVDQTVETLKDQHEKILLEILVMFFNTRILKEQIVVAETLHKSTKRLYDVVKRKKKLGSSEERHLLYAESNLYNTQMSVIDAKRNFKELLLKLEAVSGFEPHDYIHSVIENGVIDKLINGVKVLENKNSELKSLEFDLKTALLDSEITQNSKLPQLDFSTSLSLGGNSEGLSTAYSSWSEQGAYVGLSLTWDIQNTAPKYADIAASEQAKASQIKLDSKKYSLQRDVDASLQNIESYIEQLKIIKIKRKQLKRRHKLEWKAFGLGRAGMRDVVEAQQAEALAGIEQVRLRYALLGSVYSLARLKGSLIEFIEN